MYWWCPAAGRSLDRTRSIVRGVVVQRNEASAGRRVARPIVIIVKQDPSKTLLLYLYEHCLMISCCCAAMSMNIGVLRRQHRRSRGGQSCDGAARGCRTKDGRKLPTALHGGEGVRVQGFLLPQNHPAVHVPGEYSSRPQTVPQEAHVFDSMQLIFVPCNSYLFPKRKL